jgi:hypothetical protein
MEWKLETFTDKELAIALDDGTEQKYLIRNGTVNTLLNHFLFYCTREEVLRLRMRL